MIDQYIVVEVASGKLEAEMIKSYLQAYGIKCEISQEAAAWVEGLTVGPLAEVQILVPSHQGKQARQLIEEYHRAKA